mmetsp:Transcript_27409/g.86884  ORF Transcript_27409/g.86884 Transcript_27409/m.86884 type:complete len:208 (-) Transcript_27409:73-696(-)
MQAVLWTSFCDQYMHDLYGFGAAASITQYIPFLRNILGWLSAGPADFKTILHGLTKRDKNLFILPGGVAEIFVAAPGSDQITLRVKKKGLLALAFKTGSHLVPTFVFGGNDLLSQLATAGGVLEMVSRKVFRGGLTLFWGRWGTPMPYQCKISMVLADPIPVEKKENPTAEELDALSVAYAEALNGLYEQYKHDAGYGDRTLKIIYI